MDGDEIPLNHSDAEVSSTGRAGRNASPRHVRSVILANIGKFAPSAMANLGRTNPAALLEISKFDATAFAYLGNLDPTSHLNLGKFDPLEKFDPATLTNPRKFNPAAYVHHGRFDPATRVHLTKFDPTDLVDPARFGPAALANLGKIPPSIVRAHLPEIDASVILAARGKIDLTAFLASFGKIDSSTLLENLTNDSLLQSPAFMDALDNFFAELPEAEKLLAGASDAFELVAPFGYDQSMRTALQLIVVSSVFTVLFVAYMVNPFLGAALAAAGTPNAVITWKATGRAYDRLYGRENNHPEKALDGKGRQSQGAHRYPDSW